MRAPSSASWRTSRAERAARVSTSEASPLQGRPGSIAAAIGEQLPPRFLAVPLGQIGGHVARRLVREALGARECLGQPGSGCGGVVPSRLLPREQRVEGRDVAAHRIASRGRRPPRASCPSRRTGRARGRPPGSGGGSAPPPAAAGTCPGRGAGRARAWCARSAAARSRTTRARGRSRRRALPASRSRDHASGACGRIGQAALLHSGHERVPVRSRRADGRAARSPRWLGAHLRDVGVRPRAGHRAADARLLGVRPDGARSPIRAASTGSMRSTRSTTSPS